MFLFFIVFFGIASIFSVLQSNLYLLLPVFNNFPIPDLSFVVIVYIAFTRGEMIGQLLGFGSGIVLDSLSLTPFGFNAIIRTIMGHIIGRFKGVILLDSLFLPMAVTALSLLVKTAIIILLVLLLNQAYVIQRIFSIDYLFEIFLTILFAPLVFLGSKVLSNFLLSRKAYH